MKVVSLVFFFLFNVSFLYGQDSLYLDAYLKDEYKVYPYFVKIDNQSFFGYYNEKYIENENGNVVINKDYDSIFTVYNRRIFGENYNVPSRSKKSELYENMANNSKESKLEENIVPPIDNLPDGKYVQFFEPESYVDGDTIKFDKNTISCVFYLKNNQLNGMAYWFYPYSKKCYKYGCYKNGVREGIWVFKQKNLDLNHSIKIREKELGYWFDYSHEYISAYRYRKGIDIFYHYCPV